MLRLLFVSLYSSTSHIIAGIKCEDQKANKLVTCPWILWNDDKFELDKVFLFIDNDWLELLLQLLLMPPCIIFFCSGGVWHEEVMVMAETGLNMVLLRGLLVRTGLELEHVLLLPLPLVGCCCCCLFIMDFDCFICFNDFDDLDVLHFSIWLLLLESIFNLFPV